ncbi:MAG: triple tyrosine motif-containing protein [Saprospiraceae bacterium]|nr:triple tyrosine motif-containing protein [Saprospiraceae bacterium]
MSSYGQFSGLPVVRSFEKLQYGAGTQNWDIVQDSAGRMYFANNDGLLIFNGSNWQLYRLPNKTIARALEVNNKNKVYVGGQNEVGYFSPDSSGKLSFTSFLEDIPQRHQNFDDVWQVILNEDELYWRSSFKLFWKTRNEVRVLDSERLVFICRQDSTIFAQNDDGVLFQLDKENKSLKPFSDLLGGQLITGDAPLSNGGRLLCTESGEIWQFKGDELERWNRLPSPYSDVAQVTNISTVDDNLIAVSTVQSGILFFNGKGSFMYQLNKDDGLPTNNVICLFKDVDKNLWSGHSNGIAQIMSNSPFSRILPHGDLESTAFDAIIDNEYFYLVNSLGLFRHPLADGLHHAESDSRPSVMAGTSGQAWGIDHCYGELFLSHARGLFRIHENEVQKIVSDLGFWMLLEDPLEKGTYLAGTYEGIRKLRITPSGPRLSPPLGGLDESSRFIAIEGDVIWMSHPYHGVFRYDRSGQNIKTESFPKGDNGLPSTLQNHVFKVRNEVLVCAEAGIYTYDDSLGIFQLDEGWTALFDPDEKVRRLFESPSGEVWYITNKRIGVMRFIEEGLNIHIKDQEYPQIFTLLNAGWEKMYFHDERNVFIPTIHGCLHYDPRKGLQRDTSFSVILTDVSIGRNYHESIYGGFGPRHADDEDPSYVIPYKLNNIKIDYTSTETQYTGDIQYRWKLEGAEETWSDWSALTSKEFTDLSYGDYIFHLECKNNDNIVKSTSFAFTITTPWYHTVTFRIFMVCLILMPIGFYMIYSRKRYKDLVEEVAQTVNRSEKKIEALTNEKILAELEHKKRELISSTVHLAQKQESFSRIRSMISELSKKSKDESTSRALKRIIRMIKYENTTDDQWEQLMYHFNRYDQNFIDNLKKQFPDLSNKDLKICTYLRMNLSTKEIANLLNVSIRSVEAYRYRLRKKMNLDSGENLTEFIMNF